MRRDLDMRNLLWRLKSPSQRLAVLQAAVEEVDTVDNRVRLAKEYLRQGLAGDACTVLRPCLLGPLRDDPFVLLENAEALICAGQLPAASEPALPHPPGFDPTIALVKKCWKPASSKDWEKTDEAVEKYRSLTVDMSSEEPRYRHASLLLSLGKPEEARDLFQQIITKYRKNGALWRRHQKEWFRLARGKLKETAKKA